MNKQLEELMQQNLGVAFHDLQKMDSEKINDLYERASDLEIEKAMKNDGAITDESEMAAHLVDFLYELT